ncbi:MAG: protein TolQ [Nevskiaceae bacterium]|nr:MAG: protein TolQ [Nevskiaceae bacterium]TBR73048.1 MAG: protein TolQ [Nevskiaceae bacterium]
MDTSVAFLDLALQHGWAFRVVVAGLVLASLASWTVIFHMWRELAATQRELPAAEHSLDTQVAAGLTSSALLQQTGAGGVLAMGWARARELSARRGLGPELVREGARYTWEGGMSQEVRRLGRHLPFLATVGSVSPYVGLFGTVWGVIDALVGLGQVDQVSLARVAPGIAEALVATAAGLFAAIPAIVAHNLYAARIERLADAWVTLIDEAELQLATQLQAADEAARRPAAQEGGIAAAVVSRGMPVAGT